MKVNTMKEDSEKDKGPRKGERLGRRGLKGKEKGGENMKGGRRG